MKRNVFPLLFFIISLFTASAETPEAVAARFEKAISAITDYQCRLWEYGWQGSGYEEKTIDFYFKRPRFIRVDVLKSNQFAENESVGVYLNDGKVTGRRGGLLAFLSMTFDKHHPMVTTIRGMAFDDGDMQAVVERIRRHLAEGNSSIFESPGLYELVFEPLRSPSNGGVTKEVIKLDAGTLLPLSADRYEGERIVEHAGWTDYILNAGLPSELFNVRWDPARLLKMGIASIHAVPVD